MTIPQYPDFTDISLDLQEELYPALYSLDQGVSEFTFAGLYLFRKTYHYKIARCPQGHLIISGQKDDKRFFMLPCGVQSIELFKEIFKEHDYLKTLPETVAEKSRIELENNGFRLIEDRDNFDYLYCKKDLAQLPGKKFHKKRNLVNAFLNNYSYSEEPLKKEHIPLAIEILDRWQEGKDKDADYLAAREGLEKMERLKLNGYFCRVDQKPAAYTLGEAMKKGRYFVVHFEKALSEYKGIYQFINKAFAQSLPRHIHYINREQDLGDSGLRQAKMTYRPVGFIKKYRVVKD